MGKNSNKNVSASVAHKKRHATQAIDIGLEMRCMRFNEKYPVGSVVELRLSQSVSLAVLIESEAVVIRREKGSFIEFNRKSIHGAYLINLVKRKIGD